MLLRLPHQNAVQQQESILGDVTQPSASALQKSRRVPSEAVQLPETAVPSARFLSKEWHCRGVSSSSVGFLVDWRRDLVRLGPQTRRCDTLCSPNRFLITLVSNTIARAILQLPTFAWIHSVPVVGEEMDITAMTDSYYVHIAVGLRLAGQVP